MAWVALWVALLVVMWTPVPPATVRHLATAGGAITRAGLFYSSRSAAAAAGRGPCRWLPHRSWVGYRGHRCTMVPRGVPGAGGGGHSAVAGCGAGQG